jgi:hypothetical protein
MLSRCVAIFLCLFLVDASLAQETDLLSSVSPKLQKFLSKSTPALQILTNAFREAFATKAVRLYYFYSNDESLAKAIHYYPGESKVVIAIRENQEPLDEFVCLLFETLNSEGEERFDDLCNKARTGNLSKPHFAEEILSTEFAAFTRTRDLLRKLRYTRREIAKSPNYRLLVGSPSRFEEFLPYLKRLAPKRDPLTEYELQYDTLLQTP